MKLFQFIGIAVLLAACSPEARLARILRKHPELNTRDTVRILDKDTAKAISGVITVKPDTNTTGLDSLLDQFKGRMDSLLALQLKNEVHNYIINRPLFPDTITKTVDGITLKIFQQGDGVGISLFRPEQVKDETHIVVTDKFEIKPLTWWERHKDYFIAGLLGAIFSLLIILLFLLKRNTNPTNQLK